MTFAAKYMNLFVQNDAVNYLMIPYHYNLDHENTLFKDILIYLNGLYQLTTWIL